METFGFSWFIIGMVFGIMVWFYTNRASVRANRQVELLESIDNKLSKLLDSSFEELKKDMSSEQYLNEARKKSWPLILWSI